MENIAEKMLERISSYNLFNNLLPGAVYCFLLNKLLSINFCSGNIVEDLFIYYFAGMVISRIGSIIVEPICKKINFVKFAEYGEFLKASKKDDKIDILSETNNTYRTMLSLTLVLLVTKLYIFISSKCEPLEAWTPFVIIIVLFLLFAFSYRKQTSYVRKRVIKINEKDKEESC
jgi:hypothetical protein